MNSGYLIRIGSCSRSRRGFTLLELLVGFTLTVLLVGLLFQFLVPALKISSRVTQRAQVQQQATLALRSMVNEMEESNLFGISFSASPTVVAIHPIEEVTQNSERVYADHLIVYIFDEDKGSIRRSRWKKSDEPSIDAPRKLSQDELRDVESFLVGPERVVVEQVEGFEIGHSGPGNLVKLPLSVRLKLKEPEQSGSRSFELLRAVSMRNQQ